jgi:hypothetical protein
MPPEETKAEALSEIEVSAVTTFGYNLTIPFVMLGTGIAEQVLQSHADLGLLVIAGLTAVNMILEYQALKKKDYSINLLTTMLHKKMNREHPMLAIGISKAFSIVCTLVNPIDPSSIRSISMAITSGDMTSVGQNAMVRDFCVEGYNTLMTGLLLNNRIDPVVNFLSRVQGKLSFLRNGNGRK